MADDTRTPGEGGHLSEVVRHPLEHRMKAAGWGLVLIWAGIVMLFGLETPAVLAGIGVILLAMQGLRKYHGMGTERFWLIVGSLCLLGAAWRHFDVRLKVLPLTLIVLGVMMVVMPKKRDQHSGTEPPEGQEPEG